MQFVKVRLQGVSLAGAERLASGNWVLPVVPDKSLLIEPVASLVPSLSSDLGARLDKWDNDGGAGYLTPVITRWGRGAWGGYLDHIAGSLTLQADLLADLEEAARHALHAVTLRSLSDREGAYLPFTCHISPSDFLDRLTSDINDPAAQSPRDLVLDEDLTA